MKTKLLFLFIICYIHSAVLASEPATIYGKNSGTASMHFWVNGSYQGYLKPGETRYTVSDGFITNNSDRPTGTGRTATKESHGGWANDSSNKVKITYQYGDGEKKSFDASANDHGGVIFGATDKEGVQPLFPSLEEMERAPAVLKGAKQNLKVKFESENISGLPATAFGTWTRTSPSGTTTYRFNKDGTGRFNQDLTDRDRSVKEMSMTFKVVSGNQVEWSAPGYGGTLRFENGQWFDVFSRPELSAPPFTKKD